VRLSAFKVLGLFFCNLIEPSRGSVARPEISRSAEIFGKDCEVQVTLHRFKKVTFLRYLYVYLDKLDY
jgi:hypothetical protein